VIGLEARSRLWNGLLAELGINQETRQQTKTRATLEYFARRR
jgi:hypothetical protein